MVATGAADEVVLGATVLEARVVAAAVLLLLVVARPVVVAARVVAFDAVVIVDVYNVHERSLKRIVHTHTHTQRVVLQFYRL